MVSIFFSIFYFEPLHIGLHGSISIHFLVGLKLPIEFNGFSLDHQENLHETMGFIPQNSPKIGGSESATAPGPVHGGARCAGRG
jgi:hypothetical protein